MKLDLKLIGENIRIARVVRCYSQDGLANKLGKSQNWLQRVEKGEVDLSINIIESIAQELDMPSSQLLYTLAGKILDNCTIGKNAQSFNQCIFNSEELIERLTKAIITLEKKL
jgi:transcriptional regulator with XRE-family HTH domain